jgi:hypothetical protein
MERYWWFLNVDSRLEYGFQGKVGTWLGLHGLQEALAVARFPPSKLKFKAIATEGLPEPHPPYS